jgi:hypothetical protein
VISVSRILYFLFAMAFLVAANLCSAAMRNRMEKRGCKRGFWGRTPADLILYREYWRIAPQVGWSRLTLIGFVLSALLTMCFLFRTIF